MTDYPKPRPSLPDLPVGQRYVLPDEMASFGNSPMRAGMERMAEAGWFVTPTMEDPEFKAVIDRMAQSLYERIDSDIIEKYNSGGR